MFHPHFVFIIEMSKNMINVKTLTRTVADRPSPVQYLAAMNDMKMNLADPELELIDPTPDVHSLFLHFDKLFFWSKLASRVAVRWSKRMYSCAGICSYECRSRYCDIALSEPLLKLRPRKDLVETLLHEMIHAFLFVTCRDQDRDGHGPNFKKHMYRINELAGINITIYHDFHDEVKLYQTHWWRCNGPCQTRKPYFGIVRRSVNKAPGPNDYWWKTHQSICGGTFIKIKEPADKKTAAKSKKQTKPKENIMKYINNNNNDVFNKNIPSKQTKPSDRVLKDKNKDIFINGSGIIQRNNNKNISQEGNTCRPQVYKNLSPINDGRRSIDNGRKSPQSIDVTETVRNIWANKQLPNIQDGKINNTKDTKSSPNRNINVRTSNKHKTSDSKIHSPPSKILKIDDYFKKIATSVLKDVYGEDFKISEAENDKKLIASKFKMVDCPICNFKVKDEEINRHLDECLNKGVIEKMEKDSESIKVIPTASDSKENITSVRTGGSFVKSEPNDNGDMHDNAFTNAVIKIEPGCSKDINSVSVHNCPCCGKYIDKPVAEHLDECLSFFDNNATIPQEGTSTGFITETIVIDDDDDDIFDETQTFNATGTKSPCPCCLEMVEQIDMNDHLDMCLSS